MLHNMQHSFKNKKKIIFFIFEAVKVKCNFIGLMQNLINAVNYTNMWIAHM